MQHLSNAAALVLLTLFSATIPTRAQYPDPAKRITLVVPFFAGGLNDIVSRAIGQKLGKAWQLPVIVDNQVGASGSSGAACVARSGYTLLILSSTYTINSAVMANLPFDQKASFVSVAMVGKAPMMSAASKTLPARNAKELIALARAKRGELNYGSAGVGSINHMAMELLKSLGGFDIKHVPYRAGNAAVNDLVGGHLDMFVVSLPQMIELVRSGGAIGIAVTGAQRSGAAAELPTLAEACSGLRA